MFVRAGLAAAAAAALTLALAVPPAQAVPPDRYSETYSFDSGPQKDDFLSDACGFSVSATTRGRLAETVFYDKNGDLRVIHSNPSMVTIYASEYGSLETADRGLDKLSMTSDGDFLYFGTGIHLKVKGQEYAIGLWRLTFTESFELIGEEYSGRFDVLYPELVSYLCEALGPQ